MDQVIASHALQSSAFSAADAACCPGGTLARGAEALDAADLAATAEAAESYLRRRDDGSAELDLLIENLSCASCIPVIEGALAGRRGVRAARVNLGARRLSLRYEPATVSLAELLGAVAGAGYRLVPFDPAALDRSLRQEGRALLRALAVAGFAFGNVMLLSVSVWSGLASDMGPATRELLHWVSALIALPAVAYAGRPFFRSARAALSAGRLNMDVPISLAVILASGISLSETLRGGEHVYFDAAIGLLFFLLIGRYLDLRVRSTARSAAENLLLLRSVSALVVGQDGHRRALPISQVTPGMTVAVAAGERVPVDGRVLRGRSELDSALVTGESLPQPVGPGADVFAGTLNLGGPLEVRVEAADDGTLLAEIARLMAAAEQGRARYLRLADRIARFYSPFVHVLAAATFAGWIAFSDLPWQGALLIAAAVLIVTCPCALGLAVPAVQVAAVGRLLRNGVLAKSPDGLERLAEVDTIVFDKTGTLTLGRPELVAAMGDPAERRLAASLAAGSRHPLARALLRALGPVAALPGVVREIPGQGLEALHEGERLRLGSREFCEVVGAEEPDGSELWFRCGKSQPLRFLFRDRPRADAKEVVAGLRDCGYAVELLSGDRREVVAEMAGALGIARWSAGCRPDGKVARLRALAREGRKVLMVGDGLNDAPALAAAFVSASPAEAAAISQTAADFILQGEGLAPLLLLLETARKTRRLVRQNFALAFGYNALAVPLAVAGLVTPLIAAIAMSASSLLVTANAARLALAPKADR